MSALGRSITTPAATPKTSRATEPVPPDLEPRLVEWLEKKGWRRRAAQQVVALNKPWLSELEREDHAELERILDHLAALAEHRTLMGQLEKQPEIAGLLAAADDPRPVARLLKHDTSGTYYNLFAMYPAPEDIADLTAALERNGRWIEALLEKGLLGSEQLFLYPRDGAGVDAYEQWLGDVLRPRLRREDELASMVGFLFLHGDEIRRRLNSDADFRLRIGALWSKLERVVASNGQALETYFDAPAGLWSFLTLDEAEDLLLRWGPLAVQLLYGPEAYPANLHRWVIPILLEGNNSTVEALVQLRGKPGLEELLTRESLSSAIRARALSAAVDSGDPSGRLRYFQRLDDRALSEDLSTDSDGIEDWIPLYTTYAVGRKLWQGREVGGVEAVVALVEPLTFFIPSGKPAMRAALTGGKGAARKASREASEAFVRSVRTGSQRRIRAQLGRHETVDRLVTMRANPWSFSQGMTQMQRQVRQSFAERTTIEVTDTMLTLRRVSSVRIRSLQRIQRVDPQLFMASDRQFFLLPANGIAGPGLDFLRDGARDFLLEQGMETAAEHTDLGEQVARPLNRAGEELQVWKQHLAAWWLANGSGLVERWNTD